MSSPEFYKKRDELTRQWEKNTGRTFLDATQQSMVDLVRTGNNKDVEGYLQMKLLPPVPFPQWLVDALPKKRRNALPPEWKPASKDRFVDKSAPQVRRGLQKTKSRNPRGGEPLPRDIDDVYIPSPSPPKARESAMVCFDKDKLDAAMIRAAAPAARKIKTTVPKDKRAAPNVRKLKLKMVPADKIASCKHTKYVLERMLGAYTKRGPGEKSEMRRIRKELKVDSIRRIPYAWMCSLYLRNKSVFE